MQSPCNHPEAQSVALLGAPKVEAANYGSCNHLLIAKEFSAMTRQPSIFPIQKEVAILFLLVCD